MLDKQTKTAYLLSFVQMWRFFSHFGMRTLFVLYLVSELHYSDWRAFSLNALFCSLVELGGIAGGWLADRYWNLKKTTLIGGILLSIGYTSLIFEPCLFASLSLIIAGGSLFSSNITALLGLNYEENDPRRHEGFTKFYMLQNLGALGSTLLCALVATKWGFYWGFLVASSGMVVGNLLLCLNLSRLSHLEEKLPRKEGGWVPFVLVGVLFGVALVSSLCAEKVLLVLPWITGALLMSLGIYLLREQFLSKKALYQLFLYLSGLILFFAIEDQIASSLLLFAQRETERVLWGWTVPSAFITSMNPVVILLLGAWIARKKIQMLTPFALTAISFGVLAVFTLLQFQISILGVVGVVAMISLAELMIAPMVMSHTSEIASRGRPGMIMGMVSVAFSLAFQLSGLLSQTVSIEQGDVGSHVYGMGFALICAVLLGGGIILHLLIRRCSREESAIYIAKN